MALKKLSLLTTVAVVATACASGGGGATDTRIAYSSPVEAQPGQQIMIKAYQNAAAGLGWKAQAYDANLSPDTQVSNIQTMIQSQASAIGVWTLDAGAMAGAYAQAKAQNIPVIGVNSDEAGITTTVWWEYFRCDAPDAPLKRAAKVIADARPGGKVIVMGGPPVPAIQKNVACFTAAAKADGLNVINQTDNVKDDSSSALALVSDLLSKYSDVDAIWAYNDQTALGASSAVLSSGRKVSDGASNGIIINGANGDADAIEAIRQGRLTGTWDPDQTATGVALVKAVQNVKAGKTDPLVVRSTFWSKANIKDYVADADKKYTLDNIPLVTP